MAAADLPTALAFPERLHVEVTSACNQACHFCPHPDMDREKRHMPFETFERVATEAVGLTKRFFEEHKVPVEIEFSWGATEVKVPDLVDAIVDVTETGSSIKANRLRIVDTLLTSYPHFYANPDALKDPWKKEKMERIALLLKAALGARGKVGLKMNLPSDRLGQLLEILPSLRRPTVSHLSESDWVAVETVIDETVVRDIIPELKRLGAEGIIEYPLNKIVP